MQCKKCGQQFEKSNPRVWRVKYCEDCRWIACENCGKKKRLTTQQIENPNWGRFCSHKCEKANSDFRFKKNGYWCVKAEDHPRAYEKGYYYEHILVAEKKLGRLLDTSTETVHHKDGDKLNNHPDNLEVKTRVEHGNHHWPAVSTSEDVGIDHASFSDVRQPARMVERQGYKYEYDPESPMADGKGYVAVGRKVMSEHLGRILSKDEIVTYNNGDRKDNRIENLSIIKRKQADKGTENVRKNGSTKGYAMERGYVVIWNPKHPMARKNGYVLEHRLIMAEHLGRVLEEHEHVHHIDGNRLNNRIENLELVDRRDHPARHFRKV